MAISHKQFCGIFSDFLLLPSQNINKVIIIIIIIIIKYM
jgi:hypothetical protein